MNADGSPAAKEVARYSVALCVGFEAVRQTGLLTGKRIVEIQGVLEKNRPGYRKLPGTTLKDGAGRIIYTPPSPELLSDLMGDLKVSRLTATKYLNQLVTDGFLRKRKLGRNYYINEPLFKILTGKAPPIDES